MPASWTTPPTFNTVDVLDAADLNAYISGNIGYLAENAPTRGRMWQRDSTVTVGNAIATFINTNVAYNHYASQNTPANGDTFTNSCWLAAGTYTLYLLGWTYSNMGKVDWTLDGTSIATGQDWYSAAAVYNVVKTVASITVAHYKRVVLTGTINGKHASSSDYYLALIKMWFAQASD